MKKKLLKSSLIFGLIMMSFQVSAQELDVLKAQKEALELNKNLIEKKIDLVKEQSDNAKIKDKVEGLNRKADRKTDNFSSSNAEDTAKDAKKLQNF